MIKNLGEYKAINMIHSGNWWGIDPKKRTAQIVLQKQEKLFVKGKTTGFMSCNVPCSFEREDYWNLSEKIRLKSIKTCLENANWALENRNIKVPILCSLEVTTHDEAVKWFKKAKEAGHTHFCRGVAEFLRAPKYRKEGLKKIIEFVIGANKALEGSSLHLSGTASLNLMPILVYLGVTSVDGSTPVRSALGYGTIYTRTGKGVKINKLEEIPWNCQCVVCKDKKKKELVEIFKQDSSKRVEHNLEIWKTKVNEIKSHSSKGDLKPYIEKCCKESKSMKRTWDMVKERLIFFNVE